jgi:Tol biopolymer transport system component
VSRNGTLVYRSIATPAQRRLVWVDRDGKRAGEIGEPQWDMSLPTVSPDGRYVAVEGVESSTGADIWIHDTLRPTKNRLTLDPARDSRPFWSPDGKQIVFWSLRTGKVEAFIQNADGTGNTESVGDESGYPTDWSPDGKYLLFDNKGSFRRSNAGNWEKIETPFRGGAGTLSPDGRFVAFASHESDRWEVNVQPFPEPSRRWQVSPGGGGQPRWSPNGKELFYVKGDTLFAIPVSTRPGFSFGTPKRLFCDPAFDWQFPNPAYDVAPDGRRFVLIDPVGPTRPPAIWIVQNWFTEFKDRKSGRR